MITGVIEDRSDRVFGASRDALHAVDRAEVVAAVDALVSASSAQNVLAGVSHADYLVRHNLADGEDQIMVAPRDKAVGLRGPRVMELSLGDFLNELAGHLAQGFNVGTPVVDAEERVRDRTEHARQLLGRHGRVRTE